MYENALMVAYAPVTLQLLRVGGYEKAEFVHSMSTVHSAPPQWEGDNPR
jgi:hypothetical protein